MTGARRLSRPGLSEFKSSEGEAKAHLNISGACLFSSLSGGNSSKPTLAKDRLARGIGGAGKQGVRHLRIEMVEEISESRLISQSQTLIDFELLADRRRKSHRSRAMQNADTAVSKVARSGQSKRGSIEELIDRGIRKVGIDSSRAIGALEVTRAALRRIGPRGVATTEGGGQERAGLQQSNSGKVPTTHYRIEKSIGIRKDRVSVAKGEIVEKGADETMTAGEDYITVIGVDIENIQRIWSVLSTATLSNQAARRGTKSIGAVVSQGIRVLEGNSTAKTPGQLKSTCLIFSAGAVVAGQDFVEIGKLQVRLSKGGRCGKSSISHGIRLNLVQVGAVDQLRRMRTHIADASSRLQSELLLHREAPLNIARIFQVLLIGSAVSLAGGRTNGEQASSGWKYVGELQRWLAARDVLCKVHKVAGCNTRERIEHRTHQRNRVDANRAAHHGLAGIEGAPGEAETGLPVSIVRLAQ